MTPGQGPDQTLPEQDPRTPRALMVLAVLLAAWPALAVEPSEIGYVRVRPGTSCPTGYVPSDAPGICEKGVQDGPDTFPTVKAKPTPTPWVFVIRPVEPEPITDDSDPVGDEAVELVLPRSPLEQVVDLTCQTSVEECVAKKSRECAARYPNRTPSAVQLSRVTKFHAGKACEFVCVDSDGTEHGYECVILPTKPKPKPEETALTP